MKNTLPLILTIFLAACGAVTQVPPTATPTHANTRTSTSTPTIHPELVTHTAIASIMNGICATTTPPPTELTEIDEPISDANLLREFAGNYSNGDGFWSYLLVIDCNHGFHEMVFTDTGDEFFYGGRIAVKNGEIILNRNNENDGNWIYYTPVRWGTRKYLIRSDQLTEFCEDIKSEWLSMAEADSVVWFHYLRIEDHTEKVTASPILPSGQKVCP